MTRVAPAVRGCPPRGERAGVGHCPETDWCNLPYRERLAAARLSASPSMIAPTKANPQPPPRILCVDDEPAVRDMLALYLRRQAYAVETASDGQEAWRLISENLGRFDVVITDNQMPQLGGIHLVEKLRRDGFSGRIIFFSSTLPPQAAEHLSRLRVDAIVEKGRPIAELMTALQEALGAR
jgi:CheY-like chemotaxis protein